MRVINLAGKTQYISVRKYLENADLLIVRMVSEREKRELAKLLKEKKSKRRNIVVEIRDSDLESFLTMAKRKTCI